MNLIFWTVGISITLFFGILLFIQWMGNPNRRTSDGLWRDFLALFHLTREYLPIAAKITAGELAALKVCNIPLPRACERIKGTDCEILRLTLPELQRLHSEVMTAAQARIHRAARRQLVALSGPTLHIGTLAGYLHSLLLQHWQESGVVDSLPQSVDVGPAPAP